jgi:hypothetical protein
MEGIKMRNEYDFTNSKPNPYIKKLRKQISIQLDSDTIEYSKGKPKKGKCLPVNQTEKSR